jgi:hypothetical protein
MNFLQSRECQAMTPISSRGDVPKVSPPDTLSVGAGIDFSDPNSPLAPLYLKTVHLLAIGLLGFIFVVTSWFPLWHTDVWGHLKYGQWMVEHRQIPDREPFCPWWDGRVEFTQFYTLSQLLMYGVYSLGERLANGDELRQMAGGVEMIRLLHALLAVLRFAILLAVFLRSSGSWPISLAGLLAVLLLDLSNLAVFRPQSFGQVFFALLLWPLSAAVLSRRAMLAIPVLAALWANTHGSFMICLFLLGSLTAGRLLELLVRYEPKTWPWNDLLFLRLAATTILSYLAIGLLNPYGFSLYERAAALASNPVLLAAITEWQPLVFRWDKGWHWVFMISLVVIGLTQLFCREPIPPRQMMTLLLFATAVAVQNRFIIWWAMLVPWILVPRWTILAESWPARWTPAPSTPSFRKTALGMAMLFAIFMWSANSGWLITGEPTPVEHSTSRGTPWPLALQLKHPDGDEYARNQELARILQEQYPGGRFRGTILATPMQGDYLMWAVAPEIPVTYAHIHLFHPDYWEELGTVNVAGPGWWDILEKYQVNLIAMESDYAPKLREALHQSPEWKIVLDEYQDAKRKPEPLTRQLFAIRIKPI